MCGAQQAASWFVFVVCMYVFVCSTNTSFFLSLSWSWLDFPPRSRPHMRSSLCTTQMSSVTLSNVPGEKSQGIPITYPPTVKWVLISYQKLVVRAKWHWENTRILKTCVEKCRLLVLIRFSTKESDAHAIIAVHNTDVVGHTVKCSWGKESGDPNNLPANSQVSINILSEISCACKMTFIIA